VHPGVHAASSPDKAAVILAGSGETLSYARLEDQSRRLAHLLAARGLATGDHVALLMENSTEYFTSVWAALRSGLYVTPINWHLGPGEAGYVVRDCGARALLTSGRFGELMTHMEDNLTAVESRLSVRGAPTGFENLETLVADQPTDAREDERDGTIMFYSSGTTGKPKGIKAPLRGDPFGTNQGLSGLMTFLYSFTPESVYLCPAPLYHAAPLVWSTSAQRLGCTIVVLENFDAEAVLRAIELFKVTHCQFVPTHFVRLLRLPEDVKNRYDLSSLEVVVHAAAPCPIHVKRAMFEWWGPIIHEYYAGSEGNGYCAANPEDWLAHPGTVGRSLVGTVHVLDDDGVEQPTHSPGQIWFDSGATFEYHGDKEKTASAFNEKGWSTLGDIGYLDEEGFVFLTDRASNMIITGGVNVYPLEIENVLSMHVAIADVAVVGIPDEEFGESIKAFVALEEGYEPSEKLTEEFRTLCRAHVAGFKCPRAYEYLDELPRLANGKLLKRFLPIASS
jgi:acyl-CoA synthetase (AMP-forming)/AMP-acid ligase II